MHKNIFYKKRLFFAFLGLIELAMPCATISVFIEELDKDGNAIPQEQRIAAYSAPLKKESLNTKLSALGHKKIITLDKKTGTRNTPLVINNANRSFVMLDTQTITCPLVFKGSETPFFASITPGDYTHTIEHIETPKTNITMFIEIAAPTISWVLVLHSPKGTAAWDNTEALDPNTINSQWLKLTGMKL